MDREDEFDAVVVGSGFGGAVAAARFAQAGLRVAVLERGRRWPRGSFPRDGTRLDQGWLWTDTSADLYEVRWLDPRNPLRLWSDLTTLHVASSVGPGTLTISPVQTVRLGLSMRGEAFTRAKRLVAAGRFLLFFARRGQGAGRDQASSCGR